MRYFDIQGGIRMSVDAEESELLEATTALGRVPDCDLNERGQEVARRMVSRGLLNRLIVDDTLYYESNGLPELWRF